MSNSQVVSRAYRCAVVSRVAAASLAGYVLTSAATLVLALCWPAPQAQGVLWATMLSFIIYTVAVIWAFTTRSATRAWVGLLGMSAVLAALAWALKIGGSA